MSYDLNFYKKKDNTITEKKIKKYLDNLSYMNSDDSNSQWVYENENTDVYCVFEFIEDEEPEEFEWFENTNLIFNINFFRPQFFGKECFPIVDTVYEDLDLYIWASQWDFKPKKYKKWELEKEWAKINLLGVKSKIRFKEFELCYLELDKSNYIWEFWFNSKELLFFVDILSEGPWK